MLRISALCRLGALFGRAEGTEIIEFAVSLPLLVVLVVGIYDFGSAFTLKSKLTGAVREGARVAANQHPADLTTTARCGAPKSVCVIRDVVSSALVSSNIDDCGLGSARGSGGTLTWTFTGTCSGPILEVKRGVVNASGGPLPSPFDASTYNIEESQVNLTYPYQWRFNRAFNLLDSRANFLSSTIKVSATMQNLD